METTTQSSAQIVPRAEPAQNKSGLFSAESVLKILELILAGSPLSEVLTIVARLVESQGEGLFCTIWLPDESVSYLHCVAAPSLPGFCDHMGRTEICPKG